MTRSGSRPTGAKVRIGLNGPFDMQTEEKLRERLHSSDYEVARRWLAEAGEARLLRIAQAAVSKRRNGRPNLIDMVALRRALHLMLTTPNMSRAQAAAQAAEKAELTGRRQSGPYASEKGLRDALREQLGRLSVELTINVAAEAVRHGDKPVGAIFGNPSSEQKLEWLEREVRISHLCRALLPYVDVDVAIVAVEDAFDDMVATLKRDSEVVAPAHTPTLAEPLPERALSFVGSGSWFHLRAALDGLVEPTTSFAVVLAVFFAIADRLNAASKELPTI